MKTLKGRFIRTNILMVVASAAVIFLVTLLMLFVFSLGQSPGIDNLLMLLHNLAIGGIKYDGMLFYAVLWGIVVSGMVMFTCILISANLSRAVLQPLRELQYAAENIAQGNLSFEVLACEDQELNDLCIAFDKIRKRLKINAEQEMKVQEERNMLIANLSHDMRTPITTIKGYIEGIRDGIAASPEKRQQYLDTIYNKALILERLVDNMTEYSELELGRMQYVFEYVDISAYLSDLADEYAMEVADRGFQFRQDIAEKPVTVVADRSKLKRVLDNLISNAMKYGNSGGIVGLTSETDGKGVCICVSDNGNGISKADIGRVFEGFYRGDASRSNIKGNGLGLAISKQIIESHHGKIWVKSEPNVGTQVYIYIPLRERGGTE